MIQDMYLGLQMEISFEYLKSPILSDYGTVFLDMGKFWIWI